MTSPPDPLADLRNLGGKSAEKLRAVGIESPEALRDAGAIRACKILKHRFPNEINLLILYALKGALHDRHWNSLSLEAEERLRA